MVKTLVIAGLATQPRNSYVKSSVYLYSFQLTTGDEGRGLASRHTTSMADGAPHSKRMRVVDPRADNESNLLQVGEEIGVGFGT